MSVDNLYIDKKRVLDNSEDYNFLRTQGFGYIEKLSSSLWTDFNEHDPGITLLETLCYAITELGYRSGFDIADLLADENGKTNVHQAFFTARKILTNEPLTVTDYRKILIDIDQIHNAFFFPYFDEDGNSTPLPDQEVAIFADCEADSLNYVKGQTVSLKGLYKVLLDLEISDEFGDMNTGDVVYTFQELELFGKKIKALLPAWNEVDIEFITKQAGKNISQIELTPAKYGWDVTIHWGTKTFAYSVIVEGLKEDKSVIAELEQELQEEIHHQYILKTYARKIAAVKKLLGEVKRKLHAHRNLCEDFISIQCVPSDSFALCADFDVSPEADIESIQAQALFLTEQYLNPAVTFYTLENLQEAGKSTVDIFNGPRLLHGFLDDQEVENSILKTDVYVSDLINLFMDIEGVKGVKNVLLTRYDRYGAPELPSKSWCLHVKSGHKPMLDSNRSKLIFYRGKLPFRANAAEADDSLKLLHAGALQNRMYRYAGDIEIPVGNWFDLSDYTSVQHELPAVYGVGDNAPADTETDLRKAQAVQLRSYLLFFDQILADFFTQLSKARSLLSLDKTVNQTYFNQFLADTQTEYKDLYSNGTDLQTAMESGSAGDTAANRLRQSLVETEAEFYTRRNTFLDHLMARFAENFNDYVLMLYTTSVQGGTATDDAELLEDKIDFIREYPKLSSRRGKAFDYHSGKVWDSFNISGLEMRAAKIAGIDNFKRRYLFCMRYIEIENTDPDTSDPKYFFRIRDEHGKIWLKSLKEYTVKAEITKLVESIYKCYDKTANYKIIKLAEGKFVYRLKSVSKELAESDEVFADEAAAKTALTVFLKKLRKACDSEGFHLLEHILLRPRFEVPVKNNSGSSQNQKDYHLMQVCLNENCEFCGEEDPYSFRASIIMPYWPDKFQDLNFRSFFEDMVHREAPAHVLLKICWLDNMAMLDFEMAYRSWIEALQNYSQAAAGQNTTEKNNLIVANNAMVELMKHMHSEYPEARLHDCATGVTNPVMLGRTILGTY